MRQYEVGREVRARRDRRRRPARDRRTRGSRRRTFRRSPSSTSPRRGSRAFDRLHAVAERVDVDVVTTCSSSTSARIARDALVDELARGRDSPTDHGARIRSRSRRSSRPSNPATSRTACRRAPRTRARAVGARDRRGRRSRAPETVPARGDRGRGAVRDASRSSSPSLAAVLDARARRRRAVARRATAPRARRRARGARARVADAPATSASRGRALTRLEHRPGRVTRRSRPPSATLACSRRCTPKQRELLELIARRGQRDATPRTRSGRAAATCTRACGASCTASALRDSGELLRLIGADDPVRRQ